jgi:hypothetical protein
MASAELAGVAAPGSSLREGGVRQREEQHDDLRYSDVSAADSHRDDSAPDTCCGRTQWPPATVAFAGAARSDTLSL